MKSQTYLISNFIIIALTLVILSSCNNKSNSPSELDSYKEIVAEQDELIKKLTNQINKTGTKKPSNIITSNFAKEIYHLYDKREAIINEYIGTDGEGEKFNATRTLFYEFNSLKNYLNYIEEQSKRANVQPSGFKFYFAQYPDTYSRGNDKRYAKRQTIFIAPTIRKKIDGISVELGYTLDKDFKVILLKDKLDLNDKKNKGRSYEKANLFSFSLDIDIDENSLIANEMGSSPPIGR